MNLPPVKLNPAWWRQWIRNGAAVTVTLRTAPVIHVSPVRERVQLPLVKSDQPGMLELTNDRIAEILEAEDIEALKAQWNAPA